MKIKYYGTSAAEGVPGLFCGCDNCRYAREKGGRNIRTRNQALISDTILIDLPPDTLYHVQRLGLELYKIRHLFVTHAHSDHLLAADLLEKQAGHAHFDDMQPLTVYGSLPTVDKIFSAIHKNTHVNSGRWILQEIQAFSPVNVDGFTVTPLPANHAFELNSFIFDIADNDSGKRLLYANDTGFFLNSVFSFIEKERPFYDLVSFDCTLGLREDESEKHMSLRHCTELKSKLFSLSCVGEETIFVLNHFSHNCLASYDDILAPAAENGFIVSYDGLEIEF